MKDQHHGFNLYGDAEPVLTTLLATTAQWYSKGAIAYTRRAGPIVELTRLHMKSMAFDDENVAKCFGLELARIVFDAFYRDFAIARYETEKEAYPARSRRALICCLEHPPLGIFGRLK